ncbi:MAG: hypothetical protein JO103_12955 [Candidatus Eremiobacteraeota bacterium]|nr:hypothetical protein [Candidatus Eremiobacteraeota bacterium]MBV9407252.1 hypothetical protein [Candidatus Eremiobacteraeota bacterium]
MTDFLLYVGPFCFGLVVGWITYRTLRYSKTSGISDIASVIGAVGGAGVTAIIGQQSGDFKPFNPYCIGLAIGFFGYVLTAIKLPNVPFLGEKPHVVVNAPGATVQVPNPAGEPLN